MMAGAISGWVVGDGDHPSLSYNHREEIRAPRAAGGVPELVRGLNGLRGRELHVRERVRRRGVHRVMRAVGALGGLLRLLLRLVLRLLVRRRRGLDRRELDARDVLDRLRDLLAELPGQDVLRDAVELPVLDRRRDHRALRHDVLRDLRALGGDDHGDDVVLEPQQHLVPERVHRGGDRVELPDLLVAREVRHERLAAVRLELLAEQVARLRLLHRGRVRLRRLVLRRVLRLLVRRGRGPLQLLDGARDVAGQARERLLRLVVGVGRHRDERVHEVLTLVDELLDLLLHFEFLFPGISPACHTKK